MKIERSSIVLHLEEEEEEDVLECTDTLLNDLYENMLEGECIECGDFKVTYDEIEKMIFTLRILLSNAVVD